MRPEMTFLFLPILKYELAAAAPRPSAIDGMENIGNVPIQRNCGIHRYCLIFVLEKVDWPTPLSPRLMLKAPGEPARKQIQLQHAYHYRLVFGLTRRHAMATCRSCRKNVPDSTSHCPHCGATAAPPASRRTVFGFAGADELREMVANAKAEQTLAEGDSISGQPARPAMAVPVAQPAPPVMAVPVAQPAPPAMAVPLAQPAPPAMAVPVAQPAPPAMAVPLAQPAPPQRTEQYQKAITMVDMGRSEAAEPFGESAATEPARDAIGTPPAAAKPFPATAAGPAITAAQANALAGPPPLRQQCPLQVHRLRRQYP